MIKMLPMDMCLNIIHATSRVARPFAVMASLGIALSMAGGCAAFRKAEAIADQNSPLTSPPAKESVSPLISLRGDKTANPPGPAANRNLVLQSVDFRILRLRAAQGTFSRSGKIWNPLEEEGISAERRQIMHQNGLRVAVGRLDTWPQIKALFETDHVEVFESQQVIHTGLPLTIDTGRPPKDLTLFLFRPDGTMAGATFPRSISLLRLEYGIAVNDPTVVVVDFMPELRLQRVDPQIKPTAKGWEEEAPYEPSRPLRELAVRMNIESDHFLAIGPSPAIQRPHLAGSVLLCEESEGRPYESMYVIMPRIVRLSSSGSSPINLPYATGGTQ